MTLSQSDAWETNYLVGTASSFINTDRDLGCCKLTLLWLALSQELSENRSPGAAGVLQTADSPTRKSSRLLLGRIAEYKLRYERMSDGYVRKSLMRSNLANEASIAISSAAITSDTRQRCHKYDVWSFMTPFTSLQQPLDRSRRTRRRMARDP